MVTIAVKINENNTQYLLLVQISNKVTQKQRVLPLDQKIDAMVLYEKACYTYILSMQPEKYNATNRFELKIQTWNVKIVRFIAFVALTT